MHRFVVEFYRQPVAVNDLGYVSYKNDHYVLDLWGLASSEALHHRKAKASSEWMDELTRAKGISLAMIYENSFHEIPDHWIKVGELHLGGRRVTAARSSVAFYALNQSARSEVVEDLNSFVKTLPPKTRFSFSEENDGTTPVAR